MTKKKRLVYGFGVNDADYKICKKVNGKNKMCPFYTTWRNMIKRAHLKSFHLKCPTYSGVSVCEKWRSFMAFRLWMVGQDWRGKQLDKDILIPGNKVYSPESCVFVSAMTNTFMSDRAADRGEWPIGVCFDKRAGRFKAQCANPFKGKNEYVGLFDCPEEAHKAWRRRKNKWAARLAELQSDPRLADILKRKYA